MKCINWTRLLAPVFLIEIAVAQTPELISVQGDLTPAGHTIYGYTDLSITSDGEWTITAATDNPVAQGSEVLLSSSGFVTEAGEPVPSIPGTILNTFYTVDRDLEGNVVYESRLHNAPPNDNSALFLNSDLLVFAGDGIAANGLGSGATFRHVRDADIRSGSELLLFARITVPFAGGAGHTLVTYDVQGGALTNGNVVVRSGEPLPGLPFDINTIDINLPSGWNGSQAIYMVHWNGNPLFDSAIYLDRTQLAVEGGASPVAGRNWQDLKVTFSTAINRQGDYAYYGILDGLGATNQLLVVNGEKFVQTGDTIPAIAPYMLSSVAGGNEPIALDQNGNVLWRGTWTGPNPLSEEGYFQGTELVVQARQTVASNGQVIKDLLSGSNSFAFSENGRYLLFVGLLEDNRQGVFRLDLGLGSNYCPAVANSTGQGARVAATGSDVAGGNPLLLSADRLPPNQFGYFLVSQTQANVPGAGGSQGTLCLGGTIGRFNASVQDSGPGGYFEMAVDTGALPLTPMVPILAGETWNFQTWFRDNNPGATSNFSDAVMVTFQ